MLLIYRNIISAVVTIVLLVGSTTLTINKNNMIKCDTTQFIREINDN
jgi:hypothetical protein